MTDFKTGDHVLVEMKVLRAEDTYLFLVGYDWSAAAEPMVFSKHMVQLAPDQPLKEGDQVITLAGSIGFIRAIYKDEAYVVLLGQTTRTSVTCPLAHLRRDWRVDLKA
jgi:hypothetical protein